MAQRVVIDVEVLFGHDAKIVNQSVARVVVGSVSPPTAALLRPALRSHGLDRIERDLPLWPSLQPGESRRSSASLELPRSSLADRLDRTRI